MIHLKDSQSRVRVTVGKGIETGAEHDVLGHALRYGAGEFVLGIAAARRHECAEGAGKGMVFFGIGPERFGSFGANNAQSQRVVEHPGPVEKLMRGPTNRHPLRGPAEFALLHWRPLRAYAPVSRCAALHSSQGQTSRR